MISPDLLKIMCCPETHQTLQVAPEDLVNSLNQSIKTNGLTNRGGKPVTETVESGLIREDGKYLYPIRHNIPIMLIDEAIALAGK